MRHRFETCVGYQKITTDTTEFKYYEMDAKGNVIMLKAYLNSFLGLYNREIISFSFTKRPSILGNFNRLGENQRLPISLYSPLQPRLAYQWIYLSMSRKGTCLDNSVMENFFGPLKQEIYYGLIYYSFDDLQKSSGLYYLLQQA